MMIHRAPGNEQVNSQKRECRGEFIRSRRKFPVTNLVNARTRVVYVHIHGLQLTNKRLRNESTISGLSRNTCYFG